MTRAHSVWSQSSSIFCMCYWCCQCDHKRSRRAASHNAAAAQTHERRASVIYWFGLEDGLMCIIDDDSGSFFLNRMLNFTKKHKLAKCHTWIHQSQRLKCCRCGSVKHNQLIWQSEHDRCPRQRKMQRFMNTEVDQRGNFLTWICIRAYLARDIHEVLKHICIFMWGDWQNSRCKMSIHSWRFPPSAPSLQKRWHDWRASITSWNKQLAAEDKKKKKKRLSVRAAPYGWSHHRKQMEQRRSFKDGKWKRDCVLFTSVGQCAEDARLDRRLPGSARCPDVR